MNADSTITQLKDEEELLRLQEQHPYSNWVTFSLLSYYKKNGLPQYEEQLNRSSLFFPDALWLQHQLYLKDLKLPIVNNESVLSEKIKTDNANAADNEAMIFEPLHTVDYFASQGIKITDEPVTNDKLGKQMKSFTEWLKSMKKINTETASPAVADDKKIQQIAESSNTIEDVVTEAMAEVYIIQNKPEKAIEMYEKLSLLDPLKRPYFAAKIDSLSNDRQN